MSVAVESAGFDAESVKPDAESGQSGNDLLNFGGGLAAADRAEADQGQSGQVDSGVVVEVDAGQVVDEGPALQDRDDRQVGGEVA